MTHSKTSTKESGPNPDGSEEEASCSVWDNTSSNSPSQLHIGITWGAPKARILDYTPEDFGAGVWPGHGDIT
jgi:hypothetical protein